ncbi:MAG TPA: acyltransferase [Rhizomicrobium sp.]|jgi:peptidoglycan/LPS O-acetylase OafA/YrhL|nr:acyltransferase [Rhizomicrobium sp.]
MMAEATKNDIGPRFDGIDLLRGLSVLAVVLLHIRIRLIVAGHPIGDSLPKSLSYLLFNNGNNGVTVFFAISGFLITIISLHRFGSLVLIRLRTFYRYRFARIAPLLLLLLAILSALHLYGAAGFQINPNRADLAQALFAALTFHLNWLEAAKGYLPANWDILWSLSIEEMFYLFFPLVCLILLRFRSGTALLISFLLLFVAVGPFARTVWTNNDLWKEKSYLGNMDSIALGCLAALLTFYILQNYSGHLFRRRNLLLAIQGVGLSLMLLVAIWPQWAWLRYLGRHGLDLTLLPLGTCLFMVGSVLSGRAGGRLGSPLRWFGRHSYEVYLTHEFIVIWGAAIYAKIDQGSPFLWIALFLVLSGILGALVARYFSEPLNRQLRTGIQPLRGC